jgi:predicted component of viral defense system (DUF524 family)
VELTHPSGRSARLIPQRRYTAGRDALRSVSFEKRPDIAIEITDPAGRTSIWIFDPKYKLRTERGVGVAPRDGAPKPEDINTMHAYRDAIRDAADKHPVKFAAILYPGPTRTYGSQIAALRAHPLKLQALSRPLERQLNAALST